MGQDKFWENYLRERKEKQEKFPALAEKFKNKLKEVNLKSFEIEYTGYGDEGQIDELNISPNSEISVDMDEWEKQNSESPYKTELTKEKKPLREFMHVDDFSDALIKIAKDYELDEPINVGTGHEISIAKLAKLIKKLINYNGIIFYNKKYPDGTFRKILESSKIKKLGWKSKIKLEVGIKDSIEDFRKNYL